jgi:energy-coupling factor transport system ATP-binding protein
MTEPTSTDSVPWCTQKDAPNVPPLENVEYTCNLPLTRALYAPPPQTTETALLLDPIVRIDNISYTYKGNGQRQPVHALRDVSLEVTAGEYIAIIGHNGSGKSTLARHLNGLLLPDQGEVWVKQWNTRQKECLREIRTTVGMVFQSPDNQIVATIVEEDVAFGPENLGLEHAEIVNRVNWALGQVAMTELRQRAPHLLSGGQKQRVCIAGVIAMQPEVLVLDEATAMLDPQGRREVLAIAHRFNREHGTTVVAITHFMHEAVDADRIIVMAGGRVAMQGTPREIFARQRELQALHLEVPPLTQLSAALHERFPDFPPVLVTAAEITEAVRLRQKSRQPRPPSPPESEPGAPSEPEHAAENMISVEHLTHDYMRGTPLEVRALHDINLHVGRGEIVGMIGHTGSGKSTVVQHLNALLRPQGGSVVVLGMDTADPATDVTAVRRRVGLVFQFPEAQLFEQYVGDDVAFGPRKMGLSPEQVREQVRRAMEAMGLGFEEYKDRQTLGLSGGERRRVALAGVTALEPEVLVLDEPTAGLDPQGRKALMQRILDFHQMGATLVMVSHNMEELAEVCDRIYAIAEGRTVMEGTPEEIFSDPAVLHDMGLDVPEITSLAAHLRDQGLIASGTLTTVADVARAVADALE